MSTETQGETKVEAQVPPVAETENQATEVETEKVEAADGEEGEEKFDPEKALKRMERRIGKRTADYHRERARADQLAEQVAELTAQSGKTTEEPEQDPRQLARQIAKVERFTEKSNQLVAEGTSKHTDYMDAIKDLASEVGGFVNRDGTPSPFMEVMLEVSDKPTELLYYLGKNPDIAAELTELNPYRLAKKLDRIEREMAEASKPKVNNAPTPITPVKAKATDGELSSNLSTAEWMRRREADIRKSQGR